MSKRPKLLFLLFLLANNVVISQSFPSYSPNEILLNMKKLDVLGSVLYVAAHPDDENTVMLSWLAKEKMVRTSYLSITRGDGGQNLLGPEQAELLGLIRTQELLAARAIDGPEQYFTRASDFGFSKTTDETLKIWGEESVLGDVVWRIRNLKPDVIICRFPPDARAGHGNHSASAYLAEKAFKIAADPTKYPEQLKYVDVWQAKRIVWNTFNFGGPSQVPSEKEFIKVEIGNFNPILGESYTEIAAESRSQHKSQGFGVPKRRGSAIEYFVHKDGEKAVNDVFDGIDMSWSKVGKSWSISNEIQRMVDNFNVAKPYESIPQLINIYKRIQNVDNVYWKNQKSKEIKELIKTCSGLWMEVNPTEYIIAQGGGIKLNYSLINRSNTPVYVRKIELEELGVDTTLANYILNDNVLKKIEFSRKVSKNEKITEPYWLINKKESIGKYDVKDMLVSGLAISKAAFNSEVTLNIMGENFTFEIPVSYKYTDETRGELYRPLEIRPALTVNFSEKVILFPNGNPKNIDVNIKSYQNISKGEVFLKVPEGWKVSPSSIPFDFSSKFQEEKVTFQITPSKEPQSTAIQVFAKTDDGEFGRSITEIKYDHVPPLVMYSNAEAKVLRIDVKNKAIQIGYIEGAGDDVPQALSQMGSIVTMLTEKDVFGDLSKYDAIVVGVRAYNTNPRMKIFNPILLKYVENGGNMIVQYQVNSFLQKMEGGFGPFPLKLSRERVTVEEAEMRLLKPDHALLNTPNKINSNDFEGWVQERGLYFANEWDPKYETVFSSNDPGEKPLDGGLLFAKHGKGNFIFTGYAFFRQLPAGVAGSYKLFANMISIGKK